MPRFILFVVLGAACGKHSVPDRVEKSQCGFMAMSERMGLHTVRGKIQSIDYVVGPHDVPGNAMRMKVVGDDSRVEELFFWVASRLPVDVGDRIDARLNCTKSGCDAHVSVDDYLTLISSRVATMPPPDGWTVELGPPLPSAYRETDDWVQREHSLVARHGDTAVEFGRSDECVVAKIDGEDWMLLGTARKTEWKSGGGGDSTRSSDTQPAPDATIYSFTRARSMH